MQIEQIKWIDACGTGDWTNLAEIQDCELSIIFTVGYVVSNHEDRIVLVMSHDIEREKIESYIVIPKKNIIGRKVLLAATGPEVKP